MRIPSNYIIGLSFQLNTELHAYINIIIIFYSGESLYCLFLCILHVVMLMTSLSSRPSPFHAHNENAHGTGKAWNRG